MNETYFPCYKAQVNRDDLRVLFYRLNRDTRDIMCDSTEPEWTAVDDFRIEIQKMETVTYWDKPRFAPKNAEPIQRTKTIKVDEYTIRTTSKKVANYIWFLAAKEGITFETIKEMDAERKFN